MRQGFLGIDLGTSAVKVVVTDTHGRVLAKASRTYATHAPNPGWSEQSPDDWWKATHEAIKDAVANSKVTIRALGLAGQLNGFVLLDGESTPIGNAVIWLDLRANVEAEELVSAIPDIAVRTGNPLSSICVLPKLMWFKKHRPDVIKRTRRVLLAKDYILFRLTGSYATDPSDASSTAMARMGAVEWDHDLIALAGIDPKILPKILPSATVAGYLNNSAAAATSLRTGLPVATGAGDATALAVGCGIVKPGRIAITLGTAGHIVSEAIDPKILVGGGLWSIPHAKPDTGLWLGLIMSGGLSLSWLRETLSMGSEPPDFATLERLASEVPPGARGVTFLPFLEGASTPYMRPDLRGAFSGLASTHRAGELVRAVMEGVAFNARQCVEELERAGAPIHEIRLAEGGAQSRLWCQIIADVLKRDVNLIAERDTSALGAAILAMATDGMDITAAADKAVHVSETFAPTNVDALYEDAFDSYVFACNRLLKDTPKTGSKSLKIGK